MSIFTHKNNVGIFKPIENPQKVPRISPCFFLADKTIQIYLDASSPQV